MPGAFPRISGPFKGNSDPFQMAGLQITPEINGILSFIRDVMVPSQYYNSMFRRLSFGPTHRPSPAQISAIISRGGATRDWQTTQGSLRNECALLARLSACASVMVKVNPDLAWAQLASLRMRQRAIRLLREALKDSIAEGEKDISHFLLPLYGLFTGKCVDGDVDAAYEHSKILRQIFESGTFTIQILIQVLYNDVDLAVKYGHRTFLDVDGWCPTVLAGLFQKFTYPVQFPSLNDADLHPSVAYGPLRGLWLRRKSVIHIISEGGFSSQPWADQSLTRDLVFAYFAASGFVDHGQLNNMYQDLVEAKILIGGSAAQRYTLAAMVVALQYLTRRVGHDCIINSVDIRDASGQLITELEYCTRLAIETSSVQLLDRFAEAHLWIAFVGALEEQRRGHQRTGFRTTKGGQHSGGWFATRLRDQGQLGVRSWCAVREIAESFLYADFIEPSGELWFESLLNCKHAR